MRKIKKLLVAATVCTLIASSVLNVSATSLGDTTKVGTRTTSSESTGFSVDSLTLQPGRTEKEVNLNWYAPAGTTTAKVKFGGTTVNAAVAELTTPTKVDSGKYTDTGKLACKVTVESLSPDTTYQYQISNDNGSTWSKEYTYKTPAADSFTFAFTSDPQIKDDGNNSWPIDNKGWNPDPNTNKTGWAKMMEVIGNSGAKLVISAGDQVEDQSWGKSSEYEAFFAPEEMSSIAYAPAVGNHDRHYMFKDHFNLPNEMTGLSEVKTTFRGQNSGTSQSHGNYIAATNEEKTQSKDSNGVAPNAEGYYDFTERRVMETNGNYYFVYNKVLFITLNTGAYPGGNDAESNTDSGKANNAEAEAIVNNFRTTIVEAKQEYYGEYDWIIVTHHKSTQTVAKHAADSDIENYVDAGFEKLMYDQDVDIVLGGHDHVYSRSYVLDGSGTPVSREKLNAVNNAAGVIYLTGNCASDMQYYTPFDKLDKNNNEDYPILANGQKGSAAYLEGKNKTGSEQEGYLPVGNQVYNQDYSPSYVLFTVKGDTISAKAYNLDGKADKPDSKQIDYFTVSKSLDGGVKIAGHENGNSSLDLTQIGYYDSGMTNADGGAMEIVDYNKETGWAYAVNGTAGVLEAIPIKEQKDKLTGDKVGLLNGYPIDVKALVSVDGFTYGDMTSVAVSPDGKTLAVAIQEADFTKNGRVALFNCGMDGKLTFQKAIEVGVQPDMVTFTPDGSKILTADEGEPREGYKNSAVDPAGSVSIINVSDSTVKTVGFGGYDSKRDDLVNAGIVLRKGSNPSVDLEPEYIACNNNTAYITCQEANAIAVLDLSTSKFTGIYPVGFEDYGTVEVDLDSSDSKYAPTTYAEDGKKVKGIRMPDALALYEVNGTQYLLTANEGDSRAWGDEKGANTNEVKEKNSPVNKLSFGKKVTWFDTTKYDGLESGTDYVFGGRSFTVFKVTESGLSEVYDSGSDFEAKTAGYLPDYFNCSNDDIEKESRSGKKGPEPETVVVGKVGDKDYAFIALERIGGIMVYDMTTPDSPKFVNYINSRDFSTELGVDDSPEGLKFVPADKSPTGNALLLAACEVGGTVPVYELTDTNSSTSAPEPGPVPVRPTDSQFDTIFTGSSATVSGNNIVSGNEIVTIDGSLTQAAAEALKEKIESVIKDKTKKLEEILITGSEEDVTLIKKFETVYLKAAGKAVKNPEVSGNCGNITSSDDVKVVGIGLNDISGDEATLKLEAVAEEAKPTVPTGYIGDKAVMVDIKIDGLKDPENLKYPVMITVPSPTGLDKSRLVVIHYKSGGGFEELPVVFNEGQDKVSFCTTSFSTFAFVEKQVASNGGGSAIDSTIDRNAWKIKLENEIKNAQPGSTIRWKGVTTLSNSMMKALLAKKDVTLVMEYTYKDKDYVITIPAGAAVDDDIPWYGPLYLAGRYGGNNATEVALPVSMPVN